MRIIPSIISAVITVALIFVLNKQWGAAPPLGKFISPQHGFWQNAEPTDENYAASLSFAGLKGKASVYFDERLVPHVFAESDEDLYFMQGYLHAKFRLFQMDLQTKAAAGRASEIAGAKAINYDKEQRRLGMVFAAENSLVEIEKDPVSKQMFDAYTNGINSYIETLNEASLPIEYKLLNIKPEKWTNLRTALLLKMMAKMLSSGTESDLENTNAKAIFTPNELKELYPQVPDSLAPIVPKGTPFDKPGIVPIQPKNADSIYFNDTARSYAVEYDKPDVNNGSNNWVVAGSKTESGAPILCNDPHLELSLPSIWYEMQLVSPSTNSYGVSLPGSPFVIIGFNDSIAWGVTNAQRDVKDYYEVKFKDASKSEYWFNDAWKPTTKRIEEIKIKGASSVFDTVAYTIFGPVMYDESFNNLQSGKRNLAVRWAAHDPSNEGMAFYHLNRAANYADYENAIRSFECPGQNFVFASKGGDIAIWQQGKFPARWAGQGLYIMPGTDTSFMWQGFIPQAENPHSKNPSQGFLESANQRPVDSTYPYFIPGSYITPRGVEITKRLSQMNAIKPSDMMLLQNDYYNVLADDFHPFLLKYLKENELSPSAQKYLAIFRNWDRKATPDSKGQTVYQCWVDSLMIEIFGDEINRSQNMPWPSKQTMFELIAKDSTLKFADNILTTKIETLYDDVTSAFMKATIELEKAEADGKLEWSKFKSPAVYHLLKDALLPFARTDLPVGGNGDVINAITHSHGPSWRMIVQLSATTEAYGVYPGGQSGNPGSKFYDDYLDNWVQGKYNKLWFMHETDKSDKNVKWVMVCSKG